LVEGAVGAVGLVVLDVLLEEPVELSLVPNEGAVKELVADRPHPSFGEGVGLRGLPRREDHLGTLTIDAMYQITLSLRYLLNM
jgi:hypothetical protein